MPRIIGEGVKNQLILRDQFSGDPIILYYRMPTSEERIAYESAKYRRDKDKVEIKLTEARQIWGEKIIEGFKDGSFKFKLGGDIKEISSDPDSPNYDSDWKPHLKYYASDLLEALAEHVFDGLRAISTQEEIFTEKNS
jgi:hypothetical protein